MQIAGSSPITPATSPNKSAHLHDSHSRVSSEIISPIPIPPLFCIIPHLAGEGNGGGKNKMKWGFYFTFWHVLKTKITQALSAIMRDTSILSTFFMRDHSLISQISKLCFDLTVFEMETFSFPRLE